MGVDTGFWGQTLSLMDRLGSLEDITENVGYPPRPAPSQHPLPACLLLFRLICDHDVI